MGKEVDFFAGLIDNVKLEDVKSDNVIIDETPEQKLEREEAEAKQKELNDTDNESVEDDSKEDNEDKDKESSKTLYSDLATLIKEDTGLFSTFEKPIEKPEDLIEAVKHELEEWKEDYKKSEFPEEIGKMVEAYQAGVDWLTIKELKSNELQLNKIKEEDIEDNETIAKEIYIAGLKATTKWNDARIEKEYTKSLDLDEVVERSKELFSELKEINAQDEKRLLKEAREQKENDQKSFQESLKQLKDSVYDNNEIIPGIKLNEKQKADLYTQMTKPALITKEGEYVSKIEVVRSKDPIKFEKILNYLVMNGAFDEKPNYEFITKKVKTDTIKNIEKTAQAELEKRAGAGKRQKDESNVVKSILDNV